MLKLSSLILIIINIALTSEIYTYVDSKEEICINQHKNANSTIKFVYFITGKNEKKNVVKLYDPNNNLIYTKNNFNTGTIKEIANITGKYKYCIKNKARDKITVSFNLIEEFEEEQVLTVSTVENFLRAIENVNGRLNTINFGLKNSVVRKEEHFLILKNVQKKINKYTIFKIIFLILFAVFQLMMITSIFNNIKIVNKISANSNNFNNNENAPLKKTKQADGIDFL